MIVVSDQKLFSFLPGTCLIQNDYSSWCRIGMLLALVSQNIHILHCQVMETVVISGILMSNISSSNYLINLLL